MNLRRLILIGITILPVAEIACFVAVAGAIGVAKAVLLLLLCSILGGLMLKRVCVAQFAALRYQFIGGERPPAAFDVSALTSVGAAILLLVPGYITAVMGLALLVVPTRWLWLPFGKAWQGAARKAPSVIDLDRDEWRVEPPAAGATSSIKGR